MKGYVVTSGFKKFFSSKSSLQMLMLLTVVLSLFSSPSFAQSNDETEEVPKGRKFIYLTLGIEAEEKIPPMPDVITFKGDYKKVTAAIYLKSSKSLRLTPKQEGVATLTIHNKLGRKIAEYRIIVRKSKLDAIAREIQSLLGDVEGITIKIINNKVIVDGQVLLPKDMSRIYDVINQFGDQAASLVTISPLAMRKIAEFIARDINNPEIEVRALNDKIILQGVASSKEEKDNAVIIAQSYMPPVVVDKAEADQIVRRKMPPNNGVIDLLTIKPQAAPPPAKIIQVVVHYVELNKDYLNGFRFQFMPSLQDSSSLTLNSGATGASGGTSTSSSGGFLSQFTATISNLLPKLNSMKSHSHGRVLESGTILVKDGDQGDFSSMRDYPKTTITPSSGQIVQTGGASVGIKTTVVPTLTGERSDSVDLKFDFEIKAPVGETADGLIIATNKMKSSLTVRSGQSAAIGGLITNNSTTAYNRLPPDVSTNPIVSLYASKEFTRGQSQFVVFITPIIKSSASAGAEKIKKKFRLRD